MYSTGPLRHCGIMANYKCTAACRHCLYACSPTRTAGYIDRLTAEKVCSVLRKGGCGSVHIGGGEPFLNFDGLVTLIETLNDYGIPVDYIETNGCWAANEKTAAARLEKLARLGIDALCISVDPFHNEYVPLEQPLKLCSLCDKTGMGYFLWKQQFLRDLSRLDISQKHSREEFQAVLGRDYILSTAQKYGIGYGGRAINIEREYAAVKPLSMLLDSSPCKRLLATGHFHVDFEGNFIPPGCTGFVLPLGEAYEGIESGKYPVFETLYTGGVSALYEYAGKLGFEADGEGYPSKCSLCFHMRRWLCDNAPSDELDAEHHRESMMYY